MNKIKKLTLLIKEIGLSDIFSYAVYQMQLRSGEIRRRTPAGGFKPEKLPPDLSNIDLSIFESNWKALSKTRGLLTPSQELQNLLTGKFRPFIAEVTPLSLDPASGELKHWSEYSNDIDGVDIKKVWEPSRFNWSLVLARSYSATRDNDYAALFWLRVEEFIRHNPVNLGPNWTSAQEVALRMIFWLITSSSMLDAPATTSQRIRMLSEAVFQHAMRILPTLSYARSQNNNHILSEALGLVFAGDSLASNIKIADRWRKIGETEFERSLLKQIATDGTYSQQSTNYHRMMLQLALLYSAYQKKHGRSLSGQLQERLAQATRWLISQVDPVSGQAPNLGHNDGSLILPLGCTEFRDYRPTAQAASLAFLGSPCLPPGQWDELSDWLELPHPQGLTTIPAFTSPAVHKVEDSTMWGTLRGVKFHSRPAHADQLHVDLWWKGINIARDAGSYSYNDPPPWQNTLDSTKVHNTITIDDLDQMERISRFLWLNRANAKWIPTSDSTQISASHDGYRKLGYRHERSISLVKGVGFTVIDHLVQFRPDQKEHLFTIHWLLPDWSWIQKNDCLRLVKNQKSIVIEITAGHHQNGSVVTLQDRSLIRGGKTLFGSRIDPILGWESNTYSEKHAVLSYSCTFQASGSITITTNWKLMDESI